MRCFLLYIDDWLSSKHIATMDAAEERGYLRLLLRAATEEDCGLPDDDALLAIFSLLGQQWNKPTADEAKRIGGKTSGEKIRACFESIDGRLYNARLLKEFLHQKEVQAKRSEAGRAGGIAKANAKQLLSKCQAIAKQTDKQMPGKRLANGVANDKQNSTNDVCVCASDLDTPLPQTPVDIQSRRNVSDETVTLDGVCDGKDPLDWYESVFRGEWLADTWEKFPAYVNTPDRLAAFSANTPLWMKTRKYREGFGKDSIGFLKSGLWLKRPTAELLGDQSPKTRAFATPKWVPPPIPVDDEATSV